MIRSSNALLVCALFLCCLEEAVLSAHGRCSGNQCFALFQESVDFPGAQKRCKDSGGRLLTFTPDNVLTLLPRGLRGSYWVEPRNNGRTAEEEEAGLQQCSCVSVSMEQNATAQREPCSKNLDGFLCQYASEEQCGGLQAGGGLQVKYTAPMGFEIRDSRTFPQGTIAVAGKVGAGFPDSKHVCFTLAWMKAPWTCEVFHGGCEHGCDSTTHDCVCPAGQSLHPNRITCAADPCASCAHECDKGYRRAKDGKGCEDVDECAEGNPCTSDGEECANTAGDFECRCGDGFEEEDGACVDVSVCQRCEHMLCDKVNGVYRCVCRKGFRVSRADSTRCELNCTERRCPASCVLNPHGNQLHQCFCPDGYIVDMDGGAPTCYDIDECALEKQCDHRCENFFGGYKCSCDEGFALRKEYMCVAVRDEEEEGEEEEEEEEEEDASGSAAPHAKPASIHPAEVPPYIRTGSILGITACALLAVALLLFLIQHSARRCGSFQLPAIKHSNLDMFYLQQVHTETYKRLSLDKQIKNDAQIL
ncbi:thrombomodulin-like [Brachionichthys hirsutus]|uniref:thrombomodulin-like n=1 Tax=Brachionichthys hirsutus TaxID=412623 RepID=UPI003604786D